MENERGVDGGERRGVDGGEGRREEGRGEEGGQ